MLSIQLVVGIHLALHIGKYANDVEAIGWAANDATYRWSSICDAKGIPLTIDGLEDFVSEYISEVEALSPDTEVAELWIAHGHAARRVRKLAGLFGTK